MFWNSMIYYSRNTLYVRKLYVARSSCPIERDPIDRLFFHPNAVGGVSRRVVDSCDAHKNLRRTRRAGRRVTTFDARGGGVRPTRAPGKKDGLYPILHLVDF